MISHLLPMNIKRKSPFTRVKFSRNLKLFIFPFLDHDKLILTLGREKAHFYSLFIIVKYYETI